MSGDQQRWRVILAEGGRAGSFRIEGDTGSGFRPATVIEVDHALRTTTYQAAERSAGVPRNTKRNTRAERSEIPELLFFDW